MKPLFPLLALAGLIACADAPASPPSGPDGLPASADAAGLAVAATPRGDVLAWVDSTGRLVVRPADGSEAVIVSTEAVSAHTQSAPRLAVMPDSGVVVAYVVERAVEGRRFPASELRVARSTDGGRTFAEAVRPYADPGFPTGHTFHSLAVGPDGTVYVAWLDGTARDRAQQERVPEAPHGSEAGHAGHAMDVPDEPGTQLVVARSTDGARTFETPVTVADGTCQCCRTALHVANDGAVYVAWRHIFSDGARDIALARSDDGATFGAPTRVHADDWVIDACPHAGPAVTTDAEGAVHVAWSTGLPERMGLWHAASADRGATFGAPAALAVPGPLGQVRAVRAPDGRALLAFEDPRTETVGLVAVGATDTLRVAGTGADLSAGPGGWHLTWRDDARVRLRTGS